MAARHAVQQLYWKQTALYKSMRKSSSHSIQHISIHTEAALDSPIKRHLNHMHVLTNWLCAKARSTIIIPHFSYIYTKKLIFFSQGEGVSRNRHFRIYTHEHGDLGGGVKKMIIFIHIYIYTHENEVDPPKKSPNHVYTKVEVFGISNLRASMRSRKCVHHRHHYQSNDVKERFVDEQRRIFQWLVYVFGSFKTSFDERIYVWWNTSLDKWINESTNESIKRSIRPSKAHEWSNDEWIKQAIKQSSK